jgi:hypothetical protein
MTNSAVRPGQQHKSVGVAVALQCVPLLSFAALGGGLIFLTAFLFWGLGYAYLGQNKRWAATGLIGPIFQLSSCAFAIVGGDLEHPSSNSGAVEATAYILVIGAVLILVVDAWRTASQHNAALTAAERQPQETRA